MSQATWLLGAGRELPALLLLGGGAAFLGCSDAALPAVGGAVLQEQFSSAGQSCGRGLAVVMTDYQSTNVALIDLEARTRSGSVIHSGVRAAGLQAALGGDVSMPAQRMPGDLVLIDRTPGSLLTFVDPETAAVQGQLAVGTGFEANPQDVLDLGDGRTLVSRLHRNSSPGSQPYDEGDDILVFSEARTAISQRIDLSPILAPDERARPSQMLALDEQVVVALSGLDDRFQGAAVGRLAVLDRDTLQLQGSFEMEGMINCGALDGNSDETQLVVSCSGKLDTTANAAAPAGSGLLLIELAPDLEDWKVGARLLASEQEQGPFGFSVSFASDRWVVGATFGAAEGPDAGRPDRILAWDLQSGETLTLLRSEKPFLLGDVRCILPCSLCFAADAEREGVHRWTLQEDDWQEPSFHPIDSPIDLPPRQLGWL